MKNLKLALLQALCLDDKINNTNASCFVDIVEMFGIEEDSDVYIIKSKEL